MSTVRADARRSSLLTCTVATCAALAAVALAGQGLLLPAGDPSAYVRVAGAVVSLGAAAVLVRVEGPLDAARSIGVVAVAGMLVGVATIPWSPVTLTDPSIVDSPARQPASEGQQQVVLDQLGPSAPAGGSLVAPPGADVSLEAGTVVLRFPDGGGAVVGSAVAPPETAAPADAAGGDAPTNPAAPEGPVGLVVVDGVVGRADGGPIGGQTPLAGLTIETADGRRVFVAEGGLLPLPTAPDPDQPGAADRVADGVDAVLALVLLCLSVLAFAPPVVRVADRVIGDALDAADEPDEPTASAPPTVEEGLSEVLRSMLADPDPRTAVIGAYARLLVAFEEVGYERRAEETPHEHLWRSLGPLGVRRGPVHRLAELFVRARFTPHPVTEGHRQAAIAALADTVADLRLQADDLLELAAVGAQR